MDGKIYIIGYIGDSEGEFPGNDVKLQNVITQVRRQKEASSFTCYIDSPGGEVEVGEAMYSYLRSLKLPIKTVGSNMVASIATVVFMAGDTRVVNEGCEFMIHLPMGGISYATADEMEEHSKKVRATENRMIKFYVGATGLSKEAITPLLKKETWLTAEELKSFGFITGDVPLKITAQAKFNINPKKDKMAKKAKKTIWERMEAALDKFDKVGKTKMLLLKAADQTEVDFYELEDGTDIAVGDKARVDGKDAEGDITLADGRVVTFAAGEVTAIADAPDPGAADPTVEQQLAAALAENKKLKDEKAALATQVTALETEAVAKDKIVANIRKIQSKLAAEDKGRGSAGGAGRKKDKPTSETGKALAKMRALKNKK